MGNQCLRPQREAEVFLDAEFDAAVQKGRTLVEQERLQSEKSTSCNPSSFSDPTDCSVPSSPALAKDVSQKDSALVGAPSEQLLEMHASCKLVESACWMGLHGPLAWVRTQQWRPQGASCMAVEIAIPRSIPPPTICRASMGEPALHAAQRLAKELLPRALLLPLHHLPAASWMHPMQYM